MLKELLKKQKEEKSELLFKHARQLMDMITDDELVEIYSQHPELFSELSYGSENLCLVEDAIEIFAEYLMNKGLTKDEFGVMTIDDVIDYLSQLITEKNDMLWDIIKHLENDRRNS